MTNTMSPKTKDIPNPMRLLALLAVALPLVAQDVEDTQVIELSPFMVETDDNVGYRATTTLAGSRVRSEIRELGASIAVATKEYMNDVGATDGDSLLQNIGNVEVAGVLGNFSDANVNNNTTNNSRLNPQNSQRVRGLVSAVLTRDYFQTSIPFDTYNTSRVTVNRGPNSILFGLGSPGGVINNSTTTASMLGDSGEISVRIDSRGGHRETLNFNKVVVDKRFAIFGAVMNEQLKFKQEPAFEDDARAYFAVNAVLFPNENSNFLGATTFRGSVEGGEILRNPPDMLPPRDGFSSWFEGYPDVNALLRVPGIDFSRLDNGGVTQQEVRDAVAAGLATVPPGMTLDEFAAQEGQFVPMSLHDDRFVGGRPRNKTISRQPYFIFPAINFDDGQADTQPGFNDPGLAGIQGIMARWRRNGFPVQDLYWTRDPYNQLGGSFSSASIQDRNVFDYHNRLLQGTTNRVETDFDVTQLVLQQELFNGQAGIEFAFDRQNRKQEAFTPFSSGDSKQISIDITTHQANGDSDFDGVADRFPNENLGRPVIRWGDTDNFSDNNTSFERNEQETVRVTAFATLDFAEKTDSKWGRLLGSHTLTGLYEKRTNDTYYQETNGAWWSDNGKYPGSRDVSNGDNDNFRRKVKAQIYLGPDARGLANPGQVRITETVNVRLPQIGDTYGIWYFDNNGAIDSDVTDTWRVIEALHWADVNRRELESSAISLQSRLFDNHIIAMYALRNDEQREFLRLEEDGPRTDPNDPSFLGLRRNDAGDNITDGDFNRDLLKLQDVPLVDDDDTTTWSVVARYPEAWLGELPWGLDLLAHYYEGESFVPAGSDVNVLNQRLGSPSGSTEEYGFTAEAFDGRLSLRLNWFETVNANARAGGVSNVVGQVEFWLERITEAENGGIPLFPSAEDALLLPNTNPSNLERSTGTDADIIGVNSYDEYYEAIIGLLPAEVQSVYNYRVTTLENGNRVVDSNPLDGDLFSTFDFVSKGVEIDLAGQLTRNWSVLLNIAQQETVRSNSLPTAFGIAEQINANVQSSGFAKSRRSPFQGSNDDTGQIYNNILNSMRATRALDGTASQELREWRVNLMTRYDFIEGRLKGFSVGGGIRYQDEVATGYPLTRDEFGNIIPEIGNPWTGPDDLNGDLFVKYERKLSDRINWSIQVNARNIYRKNGSDDIPIHTNPDGTLALIRVPPEQQFFITNTFSF